MKYKLVKNDIPIGFFNNREDALNALQYTYGMLVEYE